MNEGGREKHGEKNLKTVIREKSKQWGPREEQQKLEHGLVEKGPAVDR